MWSYVLPASLLVATAAATDNQEFIISNGQIFTPGFAVLNAPQPGTPLGGGKHTLAQENKAT
jgi:hypothetical protein